MASLPVTVTATPSPADQEVKDATVRIFVRVSSVKSGSLVVIDRGSSDGVARDDLVTFYARSGGEYRGTVVQVNDRSAVVELLDKSITAEPGTRGDFIIRASRLLQGEKRDADEQQDSKEAGSEKASGKEASGENQQADKKQSAPGDTAVDPGAKNDREGSGTSGPPQETETGTQSEDKSEAEADSQSDSGTSGAPAQATDPARWTRRDDWTQGMPLLAQVEPVHPRDRSARITGRAYVSGDVNRQGGRGSDALLRTGTDIDYDNPFGAGGRARFDGEWNYRSIDDPDDGDESDADVRIDRLSYAWGGTRYSSTRLEAGRFLQYGVPEFGILDGVEWSERSASGNRYGASFGLLPELDYDLSGSSDVAVSAYYYWIADNREELLLGGGFQKTWHDGDSDRDLLLAKVRYLPLDGWRVNGSLWVDYYDSDDEAKDSTFELTQAYVTANRTWRNRGIDFTYRRIKFPELLRDEFRPVTPAELDDNRYDRLSATGWQWIADDERLHGQVGIWNDEDDTGGDAELGLDLQNLFARGGRGDVTAFGTRGQFERTVGARVSYGRYGDEGSWNVLYEIADHQLDGFSSDRDNLLQHRLRGSLDFYVSTTWSLSLYGEGGFWDDDTSISAGFYLQKTF